MPIWQLTHLSTLVPEDDFLQSRTGLLQFPDLFLMGAAFLHLQIGQIPATEFLQLQDLVRLLILDVRFLPFLPHGPENEQQQKKEEKEFYFSVALHGPTDCSARRSISG